MVVEVQRHACAFVQGRKNSGNRAVRRSVLAAVFYMSSLLSPYKTPGLNVVQAFYYMRERLFFLFWFGDKRVEQEQDLIKLFILSLKATIHTLL